MYVRGVGHARTHTKTTHMRAAVQCLYTHMCARKHESTKAHAATQHHSAVDDVMSLRSTYLAYQRDSVSPHCNITAYVASSDIYVCELQFACSRLTLPFAAYPWWFIRASRVHTLIYTGISFLSLCIRVRAQRWSSAGFRSICSGMMTKLRLDVTPPPHTHTRVSPPSLPFPLHLTPTYTFQQFNPIIPLPTPSERPPICRPGNAAPQMVT